MVSTFSWAWTAPGDRDAVTAAVYARQAQYVRGGAAFEGGLFRWEEDAFAHPDWPRSGKVLIAGAGGGRELRVLADRGYSVRSFEPLGTFASACATVCAGYPGATCTEASYADLVEATEKGSGRLCSLLDEAPFDAIVLGWGSLAHVTEPERVEAVLDAARILGPRGPLFTSFYTPESVGLGTGRLERLGAMVGRFLVAAGGSGQRPDGGVFLPRAGFVQTATPDRMAALASRHGYRVAAMTKAPPQPWAIFMPAGP
jgi:hypothetical protein